MRGEDIKKNQKILEKGSKLNQQNINLIAATGISKIKVFKKIKIGFLLWTGNRNIFTFFLLIYFNKGPPLVTI